MNYPDLALVFSVKHGSTPFKQASNILIWKALFGIKSTMELSEFLSLEGLQSTYEELR